MRLHIISSLARRHECVKFEFVRPDRGDPINALQGDASDDPIVDLEAVWTDSRDSSKDMIAMSELGPAPRRHGRFSNATGIPPHGYADVFRFLTEERGAPWPREVAAACAEKPIERVRQGIRATLIGHSTTLLQTAGLNILTDPIWSNRAGPFSLIGPRRVRPPAMAIPDLPRIDAILLSHSHYDHLDRRTLAILVARDAPTIVTGLGVGRYLPTRTCVELDWGDSRRLADDVSVAFVPAEHFSARTPFDRNRTLWGGFVLETPSGPIYFAGDTGYGSHFGAIRRRFGPMTLSLIPIGAYEPRWFMRRVHVDPTEALQASLILESAVTLAIHHATFQLTKEAIDAPEKTLMLAAADPQSRSVRGSDFRAPPWGAPVVIADRSVEAESPHFKGG
jgi:L-ascorbate metabolism protein UlaG (beta-lactamase superfamily)